MLRQGRAALGSLDGRAAINLPRRTHRARGPAPTTASTDTASTAPASTSSAPLRETTQPQSQAFTDFLPPFTNKETTSFQVQHGLYCIRQDFGLKGRVSGNVDLCSFIATLPDGSLWVRDGSGHGLVAVTHAAKLSALPDRCWLGLGMRLVQAVTVPLALALS